MTTNRLFLTALVTIGLIASAAGAALAQDATGNESTSTSTSTSVASTNSTAPGTNETAPSNATAPPASATEEDDSSDDNRTANPRAAYVRELHAARKAALDAFHENRTRLLEAYHARLAAIRESFLEKKALVIDGCRGEDARPGENATRNETRAFAHCVRDGLRPLKESARENITLAKAEFKAELESVRDALVDGFKAKRAEAAGKHLDGSRGKSSDAERGASETSGKKSEGAGRK